LSDESTLTPICMRTIDHALGKALALSLLLHALVFAAVGWLVEPVRRAVALPEAQLEVTLRTREVLTRLRLPPYLEESPQPASRPPARMQPAQVPAAHDGYKAKAARTAIAANFTPVLEGEAAQQANAHMARELFYPPEAIARGLEGQVLVLLFLDAAGNAIAARLEASSGHALLDDAAVRAARTLRALPDSAPREVLLPVRFRLR
jgi:protein TonB